MKSFKEQADEARKDLKICMDNREECLIVISRIKTLIQSGEYFIKLINEFDAPMFDNAPSWEELDGIEESITKLKKAIK